MPRALSQMPNTITLTNNLAVPVDIDGLAGLDASEAGKVIDLTKMDVRSESEESRREQFWNAMAGLVTDGSLTVVGASPALGSSAAIPAFNWATLDGPDGGDTAADVLALRPGLPGYVNDTVRPAISGIAVGAANAFVDVTFTEGVYSAADPDGPVDAADFELAFIDNGGGLTNVVLDGTATKADTNPLVGGETVIRLGLTPTGAANATDAITVSPAAGAIVDNKGNGAIEVGVTDNTVA